MREFFRGWRRKVGCVTLVMACVVTGVWVRSTYYSDRFYYRTDKSIHSQYSSLGRLSCKSEFRIIRIDPASFPVRKSWRTYMGPNRPNHDDRLTQIGLKWISASGGFEFSKKEVLGVTTYHLTVPYLPIAVPLTVLSAYLLFWKPRKRASQAAISNLNSN
jgi:hypothetical protein